MATKKIKWRVKNTNGTDDTIHPETEVSQIVDFPSMEDYALKSDIPSSEGFVTIGDDQDIYGSKTFFGGLFVATSDSKAELTLGTAAPVIKYQGSPEAGYDNNFEIEFPLKGGTLALTSDIPHAYSLPIATSTILGGVKSSTTGTTSGRDYKVQVNSDGTMKVNVPWTDNNTHNTAYLYLASSSTATSQTSGSISNPYMNLVDGGSRSTSIQLVGGTGITVSGAGTSSTSRTITINGFGGDYNSLSNKPSSLKNPYSLSITSNGTTVTYDGSTSKSITIDSGKSYTAGTGVSISSSNVISTTDASSTASGHVNTSAQTFAGRKAFKGGINIPSGATIQLDGSSGTAGYVLTSNGTSSTPTWKEIPTSGGSKLDAYPVGTIYICWYYASSTSDSYHPAKLFGGSWTAIPSGYALWTWRASLSATDSAHEVSAGLPNITGHFDITKNEGNSTMSGADGKLFSQVSSGGNNITRPQIQSWDYLPSDRINFDASKSSSVYGNSTTVQPPAYKIFAWRRTA